MSKPIKNKMKAVWRVWNLPKFIMLQVTAIFAIASLFVSASSVNAKVIVTEQTKYYFVLGRNGKQIHSKLGRRGPWKIRRKHAIAATVRSYDIKNIQFEKRGTKCIMSNVDVHLSLTYYFPKWVNKNKGSKKLQKLWASFLEELVRHEQVHGRIFKDTIHQFEKELLRTTGRLSDDCSGMVKTAQDRLNKIDARGEVRHGAFDRREKKATAKIRKLEKAIAKTR